MLVQLIYASRVEDAVDNTAIRDILARSQPNNQRLGITGALCFSGSFFLQGLEGERGTVNALYNRIAADRRHSDSQLLSFRECACREFSDWAMGYVAFTADNRALLHKYSAGPEFDAMSLPAEAARALLCELSTHASWLRRQN